MSGDHVRTVSDKIDIQSTRTLTDEEPNADTRHVEPIQPGLHIEANMSDVVRSLPFQYTLRDRRHRWVMTVLDVLQYTREALVIIPYFWRPLYAVRLCIIPRARNGPS
jgi:hypothetical protein